MMNINILKFLTTIFIIFVVTGCSVNQFNKIITPEKKEFVYKREDISIELESSVKQIINAMSKNDIEFINKNFVHPSFGLYNFYKIKGVEIFSFQTQVYNVVDENIEEFSHLISRVGTKDTKLPVLREEIKFLCSPNNDKYYGWNKEGLFLNANTKTYLSEYMNKTNKIQKDRYKKEDFHKAKLIEKTGYKVVLTPEIVFYMTKIDNKWYMTLIDRVTTDCSIEKKEKLK